MNHNPLSSAVIRTASKDNSALKGVVNQLSSSELFNILEDLGYKTKWTDKAKGSFELTK